MKEITVKRLLLSSLVASIIISNVSAGLGYVDMLAYMKHLRGMSEHCLQLSLTRNQREIPAHEQTREVNMCKLIAAELEVYTSVFAIEMKNVCEDDSNMPLKKKGVKFTR